MFEARLHRFLAPRQVLLLRLVAGRLGLVTLGEFEQALGGIVTAVEDDILDRVAKLSGQVRVDRQLAR